MKDLVPHWKPISPSPHSAASSEVEGQGGDPAFGGSGDSTDGSPGSCVASMGGHRCICRLPCSVYLTHCSSHAQNPHENAQSDPPEEHTEG